MSNGKRRVGSWAERLQPVFAAIVALASCIAVSRACAAGTLANGDVDMALVLAVDISYSMDADEQRLQRSGYIDALNSKPVIEAIRSGPRKRIAVTYVEWAGANDQSVVVPWRIIDGADSAHAFTDELAAKPFRRASRTSIAGALLFSAPLFDADGLKAARRVIDVSGDGPNNQGVPVTEARADVLARDIVINGLPIIWRRSNPGLMDIDNLDAYYENCVIGGEAAFMVPVRTRENIDAATRMKLLQEIAARPNSLSAIPAAGSAVDCRIGEKLWQKRFETIPD